MDGIEATRKIRAQNPGVEVVILSERVSDEVIRECIRAGAITFVAREESATMLLEAIRAASSHTSLFLPTTA